MQVRVRTTPVQWHVRFKVQLNKVFILVKHVVNVLIVIRSQHFVKVFSNLVVLQEVVLNASVSHSVDVVLIVLSEDSSES